MSVTVITLTGDRPTAFGLCLKWMLHQTLQPLQWIIVDDGKVPMLMRYPGYTWYERREPRTDDPLHTLTVNMAVALPLIMGDKILFMEDDEYYAPNYILQMDKLLDEHEIVGIGRSKYYHLPTGGYSRYNNMDHASLAQTGIRATFLPELREALAGDCWLDIRIWKAAGSRGFVFDDKDENLYVGMKGLPGRAGIGIGHRQKYNTHDSPPREILKGWAPDGFRYYMDVLAGSY